MTRTHLSSCKVSKLTALSECSLYRPTWDLSSEDVGDGKGLVLLGERCVTSVLLLLLLLANVIVGVAVKL